MKSHSYILEQICIVAEEALHVPTRVLGLTNRIHQSLVFAIDVRGD